MKFCMWFANLSCNIQYFGQYICACSRRGEQRKKSTTAPCSRHYTFYSSPIPHLDPLAGIATPPHSFIHSNFLKLLQLLRPSSSTKAMFLRSHTQFHILHFSKYESWQTCIKYCTFPPSADLQICVITTWQPCSLTELAIRIGTFQNIITDYRRMVLVGLERFFLERFFSKLLLIYQNSIEQLYQQAENSVTTVAAN